MPRVMFTHYCSSFLIHNFGRFNKTPPTLRSILMTRIHTCLVESSLQIPKVMLLVIAIIILSGTLIKSANAQSRNVDGTLLVEVRIDRAPAVLVLDTDAEHSVLDREFAERLRLHPVGLANIEKPYSSYQSKLVLVPNVEIQSIHIKEIKMLTDDFAASSGALGGHIDGVLGNDILGKFTVTLDYSTGSVTFGPGPERLTHSIEKRANRHFS